MNVARDVVVICLLLALTSVAGCGEAEVRATEKSGVGQVVDSAIPIAEALRRFHQDLPEPSELVGGHPSREALVRAFVRAVEKSDTAALRQMVLRRDEFAWIYYPASHLSRPPYELPPDLLWFQMQGQSEKGARLLLAERSGQSLGYLDHRCTPRQEGDHRVHGYCELRRVVAGDTLRERLFGLIIEREGQYKFVSYANKL
ncbi:MAG: hypothetical protein H0W29_14505 [Gemmatimonadales bacterium]|nr:hypothetical protein [Gemmatimonadales bacterium]